MRSVPPPRTMPVQFPTQHSQQACAVALSASPCSSHVRRRSPIRTGSAAPCAVALPSPHRAAPPPPLLHPVHSVLLPLNPPQQPRDPRQLLCPSPRATAPLANPRHITILLPAHRTAPLPRRNRAHSRTAPSAHQHRCFSAPQLVRRQPRCRLASAPLPPHTPFTGRLDPLSRPAPITDTIRTRIGSGWLLSACIW